MFASQLASHIIPVLHPEDSIQRALQLMQENHITQLPVISEEKYLGLIAEEDLLDEEEETARLSTLKHEFQPISVSEQSHFYTILKQAEENACSLIPVVKEEGIYAGSIPLANLLRAAAEALGVREAGAVLVLEMEPSQYSPGEISRLTETNNAMILQLSTAADPYTGKLMVTLKLNKPDVSDVVATFQRYDYQVLYYQGEEAYENELKNNYEHLMNYLKI